MGTKQQATTGIGIVTTLCLGAIMAGVHISCGIIVAFEVVIFLLLIIFEKGRYTGRVQEGKMEKTSERFIDPTTNEDITVWHNPKTGIREYRATYYSGDI